MCICCPDRRCLVSTMKQPSTVRILRTWDSGDKQMRWNPLFGVCSAMQLNMHAGSKATCIRIRCGVTVTTSRK